MKKLLLLIVCLLPLALCARADAARDITGECSFRFPRADGRISDLHDTDYETYMQTEKQIDPKFYITTGNTPAAGVYLESGIRRLPFTVEVKKDGKWTAVASSPGLYAQEYVAFPPVCGEIRLHFDSDGREKIIRVCEITVLSEGEIDREKIHVWSAPVEKADLLLVSTHPDDELLWFGGMIPYYVRERNLSVLVAYLAVSDSYRELELLNGLWHCGVRNYPEIAYLKDFKTYNKKEVYEKWGRGNVYTFLVETVRRYRPEVVVTHDFKGEYGHGQHVACAESTQKAVQYAAMKNQYAPSAKEYGTWDVKKFYVHLGDNPTVMDWHQPLESLGGKTSFEVATEAYFMHWSQHKESMVYEMADRGTAYDSFVFTLVHSLVGEDVQGGDLFENIPADQLTTAK